MAHWIRGLYPWRPIAGERHQEVCHVAGNTFEPDVARLAARYLQGLSEVGGGQTDVVFASSLGAALSFEGSYARLPTPTTC